MVGGLSSFAAYPLPLQLISHGLEMHFKIKPHNMDQIALLAFLGQSSLHDPKSDHLAVTFVKGYIMLTWNLGNGTTISSFTTPHMGGNTRTRKLCSHCLKLPILTACSSLCIHNLCISELNHSVHSYLFVSNSLYFSGPRRIFTSRPLLARGNRPHTIRFGRLGRAAWLSVDTMPNITGNAPGNLHQLNVVPLLYLGTKKYLKHFYTEIRNRSVPTRKYIGCPIKCTTLKKILKQVHIDENAYILIYLFIL